MQRARVRETKSAMRWSPAEPSKPRPLGVEPMNQADDKGEQPLRKGGVWGHPRNVSGRRIRQMEREERRGSRSRRWETEEDRRDSGDGQRWHQ
jgi:hypothetical protein